MLDLPLVYLNETLVTFKEIRRFTCESKRNPSEAPHIDSVILDLRTILSQLGNVSETELTKSINHTLESVGDYTLSTLFTDTLTSDTTCFYGDYDLTKSRAAVTRSSLSLSDLSEYSDESTLAHFHHHFSTNSLIL